MTPHSDDSTGAARIIDTRGDEPLTATYVGVLAVEAVVLAALWLFSSYFSS